MATSKDLYAHVKATLAHAGAPEPDAKARIIVAEALGIGLGDIFRLTHVDADAAALIESMVQRCAAGEPVEYVTGKAYFRHLELLVSPDVLIPRQETELVAQEAIDFIHENGYKNALDICTGSGCIAISLQTESKIQVDACDISEAALFMACRNAEKNGANIRFFLSDMFSAVADAYDIIVCNPPYVSDIEYEKLDTGVLFEPKLALTAGDGLDFYRIIAAGSMQFIAPGGALVLEIGADQGEDVTVLLQTNGFRDVTIKKDYAGRDRIVSARR